MTTLPPLCSPSSRSRSPSARPLLPLALLLSWLLVARSLFPLHLSRMGQPESLPATLMGTTLAGLVGWSPFRSPLQSWSPFPPPPTENSACLSPPGRRSGHRIWLCKKIPGFKYSDERPRLETPPLLHYSSVLAKGFIISAFFELFLLSLLLYTLLLRSR